MKKRSKDSVILGLISLLTAVELCVLVYLVFNLGYFDFSKKEQTVEIITTTPPPVTPEQVTVTQEPEEPAVTFELLGDENHEFLMSPKYIDPGFVAKLKDGTDLSEFVTCESNVVSYIPGDYLICYRLKYDGEEKTLFRKVTVYAGEFPQTANPDVKAIYLTFDDGPSAYTQRLLDTLDRYNAKATFFVTNQDSDYLYLIGEAYRRGHAIGIHTSSHKYKTIYSSEQAFFEDFAAMQEIVYSQTGEYTKLYRFPGGSSNTVSRFNPGIMTRLALTLQCMGYQYFDWNVDSKDAGGANNSSSVYYNVTGAVPHQEYPVVLQHDIKGYSVSAVEDILKWGTDNGYVFLPLEVSSPPAHLDIVN